MVARDLAPVNTSSPKRISFHVSFAHSYALPELLLLWFSQIGLVLTES
jgi:hypothetical protein